MAFDFDSGTDDAYYFPSVTNLKEPMSDGTFTAAMHLKLEDYTADAAHSFFGSTQATADIGFGFWYDNRSAVSSPKRITGMVSFGSGGQYVLNFLSADNIITDNNWHGLVLRGDGTTFRLYIDGSLHGTTAAFNTGNYTASNHTRVPSIGRANYSSALSLLEGMLAEFAYYTTDIGDAACRALSAGASASLYRASSGLVYFPMLRVWQSLWGTVSMTNNNPPGLGDHPPTIRHTTNPLLPSLETVLPVTSGRTLLRLLPAMYLPSSSSYATLGLRNRRQSLDFDASSTEYALFYNVLPQSYTNGGIDVRIHYTVNTETSGSVRWGARFYKLADLDDDSGATASYVSQNIPTTSGISKVSTIRIAHADLGLVAGDNFELRIERDAGNDSAANDAQIHYVELRES